MTPIIPELRMMIEQTGNEPVEIFNSETNTTYLLVNAHDYAILPIDWTGE